ncbi:dipicolinate synthase subunit DpsA [Paenibacillus mesotrionivorans]|uniref:Dipicolinate synthase subunit DpsA n=1 Tax=Paenibacillus mesotrionivorans TaxID=3160968 RepID=A0ACC7NTJ9_9BACL
MFAHEKLLIAGGDSRQLEVIRRLAGTGAAIYIAGFDQWAGTGLEHIHRVQLSEAVFRECSAVILPAVGIGAAGEVDAPYSSEELTVTTNMLAAMPAEGLVITGSVNAYLREACSKYRLRLAEVYARDDVAILNSIPTAEGAVMLAIQHTDITLHGASVIVLGLGRVGMTLARTLKNLGATVRVGIREPELQARAIEMGLQPFHMNGLPEEAASADILFSTIPDMVVTASVIANMSTASLIVDLASKPGGTDFHAAEAAGVKAIHALGLPGKVAPRTAGRILGDAIVEILKEELHSPQRL